MIKANVIALAAIATFAAGTVAAQGMPTTPSTGASASSSSSTSSPSSGSAAGGSGYLSSPKKSASASATATVGTDKFSGLDKDHDGMVSKLEAKTDKVLGTQFDTLDTNKDGKLDSAEFSAFEVGAPTK